MAAANTNSFRVGFGRVVITPAVTEGLVMEGYKNLISEGILTDLLGTCVAITDRQDNTLLLYTVDKCEVQKETVTELRERLGASAGIPADHITVSGAHTHSSPATVSMPDYVDQLVQAGEAALNDRAPATVCAGSYDVPNMNFVRHYVMNDSSMGGDNFGDASLGYKCHASKADPTMGLIRFVREGDKKDVVMVNWQVHPKLASTIATPEGRATRTLISADLVGYARDHIEAKEDVLFAYFNGASGNMNPFSKLDAEKDLTPKGAKPYGEQLGDHILAALGHLQPVQSGTISSARTDLGDRGFDLHAYTVGGKLGFAAVPAEIFCDTGMQIREGSPNQITFVLTCANGRDSYIPTENAWDYRGSKGEPTYETRTCRYPRGTAESLANDLVRLLNEIQP